LSIREIIGYRGADRGYALLVLKKNRWEKSQGPDEYFGHGIYFFEEDESEAYNWARHNRKIPEKDISLIQACIKCNRCEIMDLVKNVTYREYLQIIKAIQKKYENEDKSPDIKYPFDCRVINMLCDRHGYKLVRGPYNPRNRLSIGLIKAGATRIPKIHIQLCVRDENIITDYRICLY